MKLDVTLCRLSCVMPRVHVVTVRDVGVPPSRVCRSHDVRLLCDDVWSRVHGVQQPSCDVPLIFVALYVLLLFSGVV
jgi:hypothetical protein